MGQWNWKKQIECNMRNIVADIREGDKNSFKEFFGDYYPILCVFASKYVKNEEAMQGYRTGDAIELLGETG